MKAWFCKYWKGVAAACVLALLALVYFGYRHRGHVSSAFGWISEETGGKTMAVLTIAATLFGLVYVLFCLIFPFIVLWGLNDLRRRTAKMEQTIERCARIVAGQD